MTRSGKFIVGTSFPFAPINSISICTVLEMVRKRKSLKEAMDTVLQKQADTDSDSDDTRTQQETPRRKRVAFTNKDPKQKDQRVAHQAEEDQEEEVEDIADSPLAVADEEEEEPVEADMQEEEPEFEPIRSKRTRKPARDPDFLYSPELRRNEDARKKDKADKRKPKSLEEVLAELRQVADQFPQADQRPKVKAPMPKPQDMAGFNPPIVVFIQGNIARCQGCSRKMDKIVERGLCIKRQGYRFRPDKEGNWFRERNPSNIYFHADVKCLQSFNPLIRVQETTADQATIVKLSGHQQQLLAERGLLPHILTNVNQN